MHFKVGRWWRMGTLRVLMLPSVNWDNTALSEQRVFPTQRMRLMCSQQLPIYKHLSECPPWGWPCLCIHTVREDIHTERWLKVYRGHGNELFVWGSRGSLPGEGASIVGLGLKAKTFHSSNNVLLHTQWNLNIMCSSENGHPYRDGTR